MTWLRQLLDWQREAADPSEFLDALRFDLSSQEVYVFTPKGDVIALPTGLDAGRLRLRGAHRGRAQVHRRPGQRQAGAAGVARCPTATSIEIFTSKSETAGPTQDWLGFVKSPRARTKIRQYFNKERREEAIEDGKDAIVKAMRKQGLPLQRMLTSDVADDDRPRAAPGRRRRRSTRRSARARSRRSRWCSRLVAGLGGEEGATEDIAETAVPTRPPRSRSAGARPGRGGPGRQRRLDQAGPLLHPGARRPDLRLRHPLRRRQRAPRRLHQRRRPARSSPSGWSRWSWKPTAASMFLVAIQVEALDRHKLLADVTRVLSEERVNILSATVTTTRDRVAVSRFSFEMADPKHLGHLLAAVRKVDGVYDAYRVTSGA